MTVLQILEVSYHITVPLSLLWIKFLQLPQQLHMRLDFYIFYLLDNPSVVTFQLVDILLKLWCSEQDTVCKMKPVQGRIDWNYYCTSLDLDIVTSLVQPKKH